MPLTYPAAPDENDLSAFLTAAGFTTSSLTTILPVAAAAGVSAFEQETGRVWSSDTETRVYDRPLSESGILLLDGQLASLTSLTIGGAVMVRNTDFWLLPANTPPYGQIRLLPAGQITYGTTTYGAVSVTGVWGNANIPADAWLAMVWLGLGQVLPLLLAANQTAGAAPMLEWSEAGTSEKYADYQTALGKYSQDTYERTVKRYQRWLPG